MRAQLTGRYPYTYACDFVRQHVDDLDMRIGVRVPTISRSQASQAIGCIAKALGMTKESLAIKLADAFLADGESCKTQSNVLTPREEQQLRGWE